MNVDPHAIKCMEYERDLLRDRIALMPKESLERLQQESILGQYEAQLMRARKAAGMPMIEPRPVLHVKRK